MSSGAMIDGGYYYCKVLINDVPIKKEELKSVVMEFYIGNIAPKVTIEIHTDDRILIENSLVEMSVIDVEIGMADEKDSITEKKVGRFFLAKQNIVPPSGGPNGDFIVNVIGVSDCYKYLGKSKTISKNNCKATEFMTMVQGIGSGERGSGTIKLAINDGLTGSITGVQSWIQWGITGVEMINNLLSSITSKPVSGESGHYISGSNEHICTATSDFTESGNPILNIYDLKLRTFTFPPVKKFSYKMNPGFIGYTSANLDIKGSEQSANWWGRQVYTWDMEENIGWYRTSRQPNLFKDSAKYEDQTSFDGKGGVPGNFYIHKNDERTKLEMYSTNMYNRFYTDQALQTTVSIMALKKININMSFLHLFITIKPIDIIFIEYQLGHQDEKPTNHKKLSGKYMVTYVAYEWAQNKVNTHVIGSRDSWVS